MEDNELETKEQLADDDQRRPGGTAGYVKGTCCDNA